MKQYKCEKRVNYYEMKNMRNGEDIIKVKENFAKHEVFREFIDSMKYEKPYYLLLTRNVFTDGHSKHLEVDLKYREATQQEKDWNGLSDFTKHFKAMFVEAETSIAKRSRAEEWLDICLT